MSTQKAMCGINRILENLNFDNSYIWLSAYFYQHVDPSPMEVTHLISVNPEVARLLDFDPAKLVAESFNMSILGKHLIMVPLSSWTYISTPPIRIHADQQELCLVLCDFSDTDAMPFHCPAAACFRRVDVKGVNG